MSLPVDIQVEPLVLLSEILERRIRRQIGTLVTSLSSNNVDYKSQESTPEPPPSVEAMLPSGIDLELTFGSNMQYGHPCP